MSPFGASKDGILTVALDVGGANLKLSDGLDYAHSCYFPLWKQSPDLPGTLRQLLDDAPEFGAVAVTMTGELADCFSTKQQGVCYILESVRQAANHCPISVYLTDGRLLSIEDALSCPLLAAASNWHVLARFAAQEVAPSSGLLIDIGSTTCDIIPFLDGFPVPTAHDDVGRLISGELVYTGITRTPVCALVQTADYRGQPCALAKELFATTRDIYLSLNELLEQPEDYATADGEPATKIASQNRLARMFCADTSSFTDRDAHAFSTNVAQIQQDEIFAAANRVIQSLPTLPETVVISGSGEFLARRVAKQLNTQAKIMSLTDTLGDTISQCATAYALARLMNGI